WSRLAPAASTSLLRELVEEVRIESRRVIKPTFRLPLRPVLILSRLVDPGSQNTNPAATVRVGAIDPGEQACRTGEHRDRRR
ncbi:MAG TPA: hypothetical protein VKI99_13690, partial [Candidatus Dormibacteraeota bacterium]|nr:hypothetical protein [Candidatus Dormibacteraeota bacterium]